MSYLAVVFTLLACLATGASTETCGLLDGECYTNDLDCCDPVHDCDEGFCHIRQFFPHHGQTCGEDCGKTGCALTAEDCVEGLCEPTAGNVCGKLDEACSNGVPCCSTEDDCVVPPEMDTIDNFRKNGFCKVAESRTGRACSTAENCRFDYDLCVNGLCKVNPSVQEDASVKTTVSVSANAYDARFTGDSGCGDTGCLPELMRDGSILPESRWSCSENLGAGTCFVEYTFHEPQDVISMNIAFYKGDERKRTLQVLGDGSTLGTFESSGTTLEFENWTLNAKRVSSIMLIARGLGHDGWISITEVQLLDRNYANSSC